jgi:hypothetical protein
MIKKIIIFSFVIFLLSLSYYFLIFIPNYKKELLKLEKQKIEVENRKKTSEIEKNKKDAEIMDSVKKLIEKEYKIKETQQNSELIKEQQNKLKLNECLKLVYQKTQEMSNKLKNWKDECDQTTDTFKKSTCYDYLMVAYDDVEKWMKDQENSCYLMFK